MQILYSSLSLSLCVAVGMLGNTVTVKEIHAVLHLLIKHYDKDSFAVCYAHKMTHGNVLLSA